MTVERIHPRRTRVTPSPRRPPAPCVPVLAGTALLLLCQALVPDALSAQEPTAQPRDRSWEFLLIGNLERRTLDDRPSARGGSLGVQAGHFLPECLTGLGDLQLFVSLVQNRTIGAKRNDDVALFTGSVGLQLESPWPRERLRLVARVAGGLRHTAEVLDGDRLTNYSGSGHTVSVGIRWPLRSVPMELSLARSSGTFREAQVQDLGDFTDFTDRAHVRHDVWRLGLGLVL